MALAQQSTDTVPGPIMINVQAKLADIDPSGSIYIVTPTNQLYKYSKKGALLSTLNYNYNGSISHIDVSNPMEIYVFYRELNKIVFLDNNLAYRGELDLASIGCQQAVAIARSYDNGIWAFDISDFQLKKFAKDGSNPQLSGNMKQFVQGEISSTVYICENGKNTVMSDSISGIHFFDLNATYIRTVFKHPTGPVKCNNSMCFFPLSNQSDFCVADNTPNLSKPITHIAPINQRFLVITPTHRITVSNNITYIY